jgi:hypothetical protein
MLEGQVRDLQAKEYLYWHLTGTQVWGVRCEGRAMVWAAPPSVLALRGSKRSKAKEECGVRRATRAHAWCLHTYAAARRMHMLMHTHTCVTTRHHPAHTRCARSPRLWPS